MTYLRFYNPVRPAFRTSETNEAYNHLMQHINTGNNCGCYQGKMPASNISESDSEYRLEIALPGVDKKHIRINHDNGMLTISVEKNDEKESHDLYSRHEFDYSGTSRTFKLGDKVDAEHISARYENGILMLQLPKKEAFVNKPAKSIFVE